VACLTNSASGYTFRGLGNEGGKIHRDPCSLGQAQARRARFLSRKCSSRAGSTGRGRPWPSPGGKGSSGVEEGTGKRKKGF